MILLAQTRLFVVIISYALINLQDSLRLAFNSPCELVITFEGIVSDSNNIFYGMNQKI